MLQLFSQARPIEWAQIHPYPFQPTSLGALGESQIHALSNPERGSDFTGRKRRGLEADPVADSDLVDLPLYGAPFTWSNMRKGKEMEIRCRLDLLLIDSDWEDLTQDTQKWGPHSLTIMTSFLFRTTYLHATPSSFELMWLSLSKSRTQSCEAKECNILLTWYNLFQDS